MAEKQKAIPVDQASKIKFRHTKAHDEMLATLSAGFAEVSLASIVIPFLLNELRPWYAILGLALTVAFSLFSLYAFDKAKQ